MAKKTAIYLRVSSAQQKLDSQLDQLTRWVEQNDRKTVKWYRDKYSGRTLQRPGFEKLDQDLAAGRISEIVVWRLDRLGRTASGLASLFEDLGRYKCNLISIKDNLDLSTAAGRLHAHIIASVAMYETELRGERVKAGQEAARSRGKKWGGSKKGKRKGKTEERMKSVLALLGQGLPKTQIAKATGISAPTVYSILKEWEARSH